MSNLLQEPLTMAILSCTGLKKKVQKNIQIISVFHFITVLPSLIFTTPPYCPYMIINV